MTHCPKKPARILYKKENADAIQEFSEKIMSQITEFAESHSMDEMLILSPEIADNWMECPICESRVCETQGNAYGMVISQIMAFLNSEF